MIANIGLIAGLALLAGIGIWLRVAWIRRQLRKNGVKLHEDPARHNGPGNVIDAEYTVVEDARDSPDRQD